MNKQWRVSKRGGWVEEQYPTELKGMFLKVNVMCMLFVSFYLDRVPNLFSHNPARTVLRPVEDVDGSVDISFIK